VKKAKEAKESLNKLFKKAENFLSKVSKKDRLCIVHDSDPDGVCSAVITIKTLKKLGFEKIVTKTSSPDLLKRKSSEINKILDKKFENTIILDLAPHLYQKAFKKIKNTKKYLLIFDHHLTSEIKLKNVVYINPRLIKKRLYMPTSYLVFKFFSQLADIRDAEWVAVIGTIADYGINEDTKDMLGKYLKKKKYDVRKVWSTDYGKAAMTMNAATAIIGAEKSLKILLQLKNFTQFKKVREFKNSAENFEKEFEKKKKEVGKKLEFYPEFDLSFSMIKTKYKHIASAVSSRISREKPQITLILFEKVGKIYKIHGRSQSGKVNIGLLFTKLNVGGGHVQAGGGSIKEKELHKFKERLMEEIKTYQSTKKAK